MRYNERELLFLARQPAEKAAEILMRLPKKGSGEGELAGRTGKGWEGAGRGRPERKDEGRLEWGEAGMGGSW